MKQFKYAHNPKPNPTGPGRRSDPNSWSVGPDPYLHELHYAWLKHRSQARFRKEEYHITFEEWCTLWTPDTFAQRGRTTESLILSKVSITGTWNIDNVQVNKRKNHLKRNQEFRDARNVRRG